jgi:hypothetical protein
MLFKETMSVYTQNHRKHINRNLDLSIVKGGGTYSYHWALKGYTHNEVWDFNYSGYNGSSAAFRVLCVVLTGRGWLSQYSDWTTGIRFQKGEGTPRFGTAFWGPFSCVVKGQKRETETSFLSSAEVKNACTFTSTPPYVFMA